MSNTRESSELTPGVVICDWRCSRAGNTVAVSFAKRGARAVVLFDIQDESTFTASKNTMEAYGTKCLAIQADVTKEAEVERAVAEAVERLGRIDYAANFAGITGGRQSVSEITLDQFQKAMVVNSSGVLLSTELELRQVMKQISVEVEEGRVPQLGSIVNCASINSTQAHVGSIAYIASKHTVVGITKVAALKARKHRIRVNAIPPGFLYTPIITDAFKGTGERGAAQWKLYKDWQGRQATSDEIGDAVVLLSSPSICIINRHNLVADNGFIINEATT